MTEIFLDQPYATSVAQPQTILDLGGNAGYTAAWFASQYPDAAVACVEPEPDNAATIELTKRLSRLNHVQVIQAAVSDRVGTAKFHLSEAADCHGLTDRESVDMIEVKTRTVPSIMQLLGWSYIDILKIDIEGGEREVFRGSPEWLLKVGIIIGELHKPYGPAELSQDLRNFDIRFTDTRFGNVSFVAYPRSKELQAL